MRIVRDVLESVEIARRGKSVGSDHSRCEGEVAKIG